MHIATIAAFEDEMEKISSMAEHALDVGGLAMLAAPTVSKHFANKEWSEKNKRRAELGGLGVLAAHPAYSMAKRLIKKGSVTKNSSAIGQVRGAFGAGTSHFVDTTRRAAATKMPSLAERVLARRQAMTGAPKAAPIAGPRPSSPNLVR